MRAKLTTVTKDHHRAGLASAVFSSTLALILFSTTLPAQEPAFRSGVELVQVDVVVVDRDGKHVRGLKSADFTVLCHGRRPCGAKRGAPSAATR